MLHVSSVFCFVAFLSQLAFPCSLQAQEQPPQPTNHRSKLAFQLVETGLITEGIAYDPKTRTFFVSSVHERKIISHDAKETHTFSLPGDSLRGVFGLKVDMPRRLLWACSSALPQAKGSSTVTDGRTALVSYDLKTKHLAGTYPVTPDGKPHLLGDLTVSKGGVVYSTDSRTPWIYRLEAGQKTIEPFLTDSLFYSLQGLALSEDEQTLYIADYRHGPLAVNLTTKQVTRLPWPKETDLRGIDGLYYYKNSLIAIQNQAKPYKVIRLYLEKTTTTIERIETLDIGHPLVTEPTLGVVVDKQFYYIANSQWDAFDNTGKAVPNYPAQKPTILVLNLD